MCHAEPPGPWRGLAGMQLTRIPARRCEEMQHGTADVRMSTD